MQDISPQKPSYTSINLSKQHLKSFLSKLVYHPEFVPVVTLVTFSLLIFRQLFVGLLPYPGNLLVSFFFPWYAGGWTGYDSWTRHKEFIASDAIRQGIPWRSLAINQLTHFHWPLWNPYNFAGTPLLANLQSSTFYPGNLLFFIMPFIAAWTIYIALQPLLMSLFTYVYLRTVKLSRLPSVISAIAITGSSFMIIWLELGIVGHTILWLPLMLFCIEKLLQPTPSQKYHLSYFLLLIFASTSSILSGHLQTALHVFVVTGLYWLFRLRFSNSKFNWHHLFPVFFWIALTLGLTAFQLLPAFELRSLSPMVQPFVQDIFVKLMTPWQNLLTLFAPDFFGNPATLNFWSDIYGDGTPFLGIIPLFFAIYSLFVLIKKNRSVQFWTLLTLIYLMYVFPGPIYQLARHSHISLFTTTTASRASFVVIFGLGTLAAYGLNHWWQAKKLTLTPPFIITLFLISLVYGLLWLTALWGQRLFPSLHLDPLQLATSRRNLIIPSAIWASFLATAALIYFRLFKRWLIIIALLLPLSFFALYRYQKVSPFSPAKFFFPNHPLISYIQNHLGADRTLGFDTARFDKNFSTYYRIFSPEGYDSLSIDRYDQFISSIPTGDIPSIYSKSDADFPKEDDGNRNRLMNLIGVKYILDKNDTEIHDWNPEPEKFPGDPVELIWQDGKFKIYHRLQSLNRAFLVGKYQTISDPNSIISTLYSPSFDPGSQLILEHPLPSSTTISTPTNSQVTITNYQPNSVDITTSADTNTLLFISDAFYPGWQASVDRVSTPIYRADYAFRAIYVPAGTHQINFSYHPDSFYRGLIITISSLAALLISSFYLHRSHRINL